MKIIIIPADGEPRVTETTGDVLEALQAAVGGWIEGVALPTDEYRMYCNEEGKLTGLPFNDLASSLYDSAEDFIVGDAVLTGPEDGEGTDVPQALIDRLVRETGS